MRVAGARAVDHRARLASFDGAVVTSVMAWRYGVTMGFNDEPRSINVEGEALIRFGERSERFDAAAAGALAKRLIDLIGRRIDRIAVTDTGALVIAFEGDVVLTVPPDPSGYESYVVSFPDEFILAG